MIETDSPFASSHGVLKYISELGMGELSVENIETILNTVMMGKWRCSFTFWSSYFAYTALSLRMCLQIFCVHVKFLTYTYSDFQIFLSAFSGLVSPLNLCLNANSLLVKSVLLARPLYVAGGILSSLNLKLSLFSVVKLFFLSE